MRFATLNIYGGTLLNQAISKLKHRGIEALCLQEVHEGDIERLKTELGLPYVHFSPMWDVQSENPFNFKLGQMGVAVLTKHPTKFSEEYYVAAHDNIPRFDLKAPNACARVLLSAEIDHPVEGKLLIGTTHFTWTPDGASSAEQEHDVVKLLELLKTKEDFILGADLNAPRGGDIAIRFTNLLVDQLPKTVKNTIDHTNHRNPSLRLVVDAVLTSKNIETKEFESVDGVSDHIALILSVSKKGPNISDGTESRKQANAEQEIDGGPDI